MKQLKLAAASLFFLFLLIHLCLNIANSLPIIFADEGDYLQLARNIAAGLPLFQTRFFPGYSLFISPLFLLSQDINKIYPLVQILNSLVMSLIPVFIFCILDRLRPHWTWRQKLGGTCIIALYPAYVAQSNLALSEGLLETLFALALFLLVQISRSDKIRLYLVAYLGVLFLFPVIHGRGFGVLIGGLLALLPLFWKNFSQLSPARKKLSLVLFAAVTLLTTLVTFWILERRLRYGYNNEYFKILASGDYFERGGNFILNIVGTFWYLTLATLGLFWLGILRFWEVLRSSQLTWREKLPYAFTLLAFVFVMLIANVDSFEKTALLIAPGRADSFIYGRYIEPVILLFVIEGLIAFSEKGWRSYLAAQLMAALPLSVLMIVFRESILQGLTMDFFHVMGISALGWRVTPPFYQFNLQIFLFLWTCITLLLFIGKLKYRPLAYSILGLFFVSNIITTNIFANLLMQIRYPPREIAAIARLKKDVAAQKEGPCVQQSPRSAGDRPYIYRLHLPPETNYIVTTSKENLCRLVLR